MQLTAFSGIKGSLNKGPSEIILEHFKLRNQDKSSMDVVTSLHQDSIDVENLREHAPETCPGDNKDV